MNRFLNRQTLRAVAITLILVAFGVGIGLKASQVNAFYDFLMVTGLSNPPSGNGRVYVDSSLAELNCLTSAGATCMPSLIDQDQRALANNSTTQSISSGVGTSLTFDTNVYDTASIHSTSINTSRFTAPASGNYTFYCQVTWAAAVDVTNIRALSISVNGTGTNAQVTSIGSAVFQKSQALSLPLHMSSGDYAECVVFQSSGGSINAESLTSYGSLYRMN